MADQNNTNSQTQDANEQSTCQKANGWFRRNWPWVAGGAAAVAAAGAAVYFILSDNDRGAEVASEALSKLLAD